MDRMNIVVIMNNRYDLGEIKQHLRKLKYGHNFLFTETLLQKQPGNWREILEFADEIWVFGGERYYKGGYIAMEFSPRNFYNYAVEIGKPIWFMGE